LTWGEKREVEKKRTGKKGRGGAGEKTAPLGEEFLRDEERIVRPLR